MKTLLFSKLKLRELEFKNRIFIAPMCQYSCEDGMPNDWHLVHLGSRAVGGAACIIQEATAVSPEGRISPADAGIWNYEQAQAYQRITGFLKDNGAIPAIQLAHAGRKASTAAPWVGGYSLDESEGGWRPLLAPSAIPFDLESPVPQEMTLEDIDQLVEQFVAATHRSQVAGFEVVEIHAAHGYLLHEFLSPLSNQRTDDYGGSLENRMRFPLRVAQAVREAWPEHLPVLVRISATDWVKGGWDLEQSIEFCKHLKDIGIDLIDVSTGALVPDVKIPARPGYQIPFAEAIRREAGIPTGAVGLITTASQAEQTLATGQADVVLLGRESLRDPHWPLHAAHFLGAEVNWPKQYQGAKPH